MTRDPKVIAAEIEALNKIRRVIEAELQRLYQEQYEG